MDPHTRADGGGHRNGLLLHHRPADPGSHRLLHQRLALAHIGRLSALLCVLPLLMVRLLLMTGCTKQSSKEQHLFEIEIFCNITVTFDQLNAPFLNKSVKSVGSWNEKSSRIYVQHY